MGGQEGVKGVRRVGGGVGGIESGEKFDERETNLTREKMRESERVTETERETD